MSGSFFVPHDIAGPLREAETGALAGLTAVVKDMYDIRGERTGGGSPDWLAGQKPAVRHAAAVERILAAGATIVGKTICEELFYSIVGINAHYGMPANVRAQGRVPGGSSSGSAAACGASVCDFALGSDTAGSIRIPASFNGLYGLRPTHGRIDLAGAMAMAPTFDTGGWFATGPGVFAKVGEVLLDTATLSAEPNRLLIATDMFAAADDGVASLCRQVLARAASVLPLAEEVAISPDAYSQWSDAFRLVQGYEVWQTFGAFVERARPNVGPGIKERVAFAASVSADQASSARVAVDEARAAIRARIVPGTLVALPTSPSIAPKVEADGPEMETLRARIMRLTGIAGLGGLPQVTVPAGTVSGCPVGLSIIAWPGGDEALLALAARLARHCGVVVP